MEEAAEGHFTTEAQQWNQDEQTPTVSGQVIFTLRPNIIFRRLGPSLFQSRLNFANSIRVNHQMGEWGRGGNPEGQ